MEQKKNSSPKEIGTGREKPESSTIYLLIDSKMLGKE